MIRLIPINHVALLGWSEIGVQQAPIWVTIPLTRIIPTHVSVFLSFPLPVSCAVQRIGR